jgi:hypothetical protein
VFELDTVVRLELLTADAKKLGGLDSVTSKKAVKTMRRGVARCTMITNKYTPATPTQNQRGTQSCRTSSDYNNIV